MATLSSKTLTVAGLAVSVAAILVPWGTCVSRSELKAHALEEKTDRESGLTRIEAKVDRILELMLRGGQ